MARLVIYSSGAVNQTIELTGRGVRIGRAEENDVVLADPTQIVSRFHAELRCEDGHYILLDLDSANGTWVWDHRIQRIVLGVGTVAEIGSYRLALEADTEAATAPPMAPVPPLAPAAPSVVSGMSAAPPVVSGASSTEKQDVAAPAVSARLGDDAFVQARTFDALGRTEDAIVQYERAVQWLAPDDPNRKTAQQRLDVLRAGVIK
jgi:predicted component of type VI protein secretion system